jgi:hypothetical protein
VLAAGCSQNARNVLVRSSPSGGVVAKLADLGISRVIKQHSTHRTTNTVGTMSHMVRPAGRQARAALTDSVRTAQGDSVMHMLLVICYMPMCCDAQPCHAACLHAAVLGVSPPLLLCCCHPLLPPPPSPPSCCATAA